MKHRSEVMVLVACMLLGACQHLPAQAERKEDERALAPGTTSPLDRMILPAERNHEAESAFRLVEDGYEAFALRVQSARLAERSLDVQTYIWHPDTAGTYLAYALLNAADRGVKVRILVDDLDARQHNYAFAALAAHPQVSVRLFNPFASRTGFLAKLGEGLWRFGELNRRMHNKSWIADNRLAIAGGRNLGDEYFDASEQVNFVDLDMAMIGPVVREVSASFDAYWNAASSYPVEALSPEAATAGSLDELRERLDRRIGSETTGRYAAALQDDPAIQRLVQGDWPMHWSSAYAFWSDSPLKVSAADTQEPSTRSAVLGNLLQKVQTARDRLWIISPYFVPGDQGTTLLSQLAARDVDVRVITNSLAANDVVAVHSGYEKYRETLLENGVALWELKPVSVEQSRTSLFGSSAASLHTKALMIDDSQVFVGSYNLDPRSTSLNTEQGVFVHSDAIGQRFQALFALQADADHSWRLAIRDSELVWSDDETEHASEPGASWSRRVISTVLGWFPLERQL